VLVIRCDLFCTSLGFVWHIEVVFNGRMALELKASIIQSGTLKRNETKEYQTKVRIPYCIKCASCDLLWLQTQSMACSFYFLQQVDDI
jgi:hypothetical protein